MRTQAGGAVLNPLRGISKAPTALVAQCIERTVTEQAIECLRICALMTGKIFTLPILKETVVIHHKTPVCSKKIPRCVLGRFLRERHPLSCCWVVKGKCV